MKKYMLAKFIIRRLECCKDTKMKAYNITQLTVKLKSNDGVQYRNKILLC